MSVGKRILLAGAFFLSVGAPTHADEQMIPLAVNGTWIAMAHRPSMIAPADVCVAMDTTSGVALWAGPGDVQFRVINKKWSLPAHVVGQIVVSVGGWSSTLDITDNDDTMVMASLDEDQRGGLLKAMDKAGSMSVKVGKAGPVEVSLAGSTKVTNAWLACAGLSGGTGGADSNPFK